MTWKKGESGNPRGRKPGSINFTKLRTAIAGDIPEILDAMKTAAKQGDVQAAKLLLDRCLPALKPGEAPVHLSLEGTPTEAARAVLGALSAASITPDQAAKLLQGLGTLARIIELDELTARIEALEARQHERTPAN